MADPIERLRAQRESWLDLEGGKRLKIRRPAETEFGGYIDGVQLEHVQRCVIDWEGFTETDLFGEGKKKVPFDPALWAEYVADDAMLMSQVAAKLVEIISTYLEGKKAAQGNSQPS
jgi:hypothetical protein